MRTKLPCTYDIMKEHCLTWIKVGSIFRKCWRREGGQHIEKGREQFLICKPSERMSPLQMKVLGQNTLKYPPRENTELPFVLNVFYLTLVTEPACNYRHCIIKHSSSYLFSVSICSLTRLTGVIPIIVEWDITDVVFFLGIFIIIMSTSGFSV